MAVAHDSIGGSGSWNTATTNNHTHTPSGTLKGVAALIVQNGNGDEISGVTYGGTAMRRVYYMQRTATETCAVYLYVLESGIPTGAQTVAATSSGTLVKACRSFGVTATGNTMLAALNFGSGLAANPSLAIDAAASCVLYYGMASGLNTPVSTPESGTTQTHTEDLGSISGHWGRKDSDGSSTTIGWTAASDDFAHIAFGFREAVGPQIVPFTIAHGNTTTPKDIVVSGCLDGDLLVAIAQGDAGVSGDDVTAVTTTTQAGSTGSWTENHEDIDATNECWLHVASAEVTADGSVTVRVSRTMTGTARIWGFSVLRCRDHGGVGNVASVGSPGTAEVVSLGVSADSAVGAADADWSAAAVATAWVPADGIFVYRTAEGDATFHTAYWLGQASGTRSYGSSGSSGTDFTVVAVEILAAGGAEQVTLTPASFAFTAVPLTLTPTAVLSPASMALSAVPLTLTPAAVIAPATLAFSAVALTFGEAPSAVTLSPATLAFSAVALTPESGPTAVTVTPATVAFTAVAISPAAGSTSVTLSPATVVFTAVAISAAAGSSQVTLSPASIIFTAVAITAAPPGGLVLTAAVLVFTAVRIAPATSPWDPFDPTASSGFDPFDPNAAPSTDPFGPSGVPSTDPFEPDASAHFDPFEPVS